MSTARVDTVGATCAICCRNQIFLGEFVLTGATPGERYDEMTPHLTRKGWAVRTNPRGAREIVCPNCIATLKQREAGPLPVYEPLKPCPKCGCASVVPRHCIGLAQDCELGVVRDHLHLTCERCHYSRITRCADENPSWWRRLLRRAK